MRTGGMTVEKLNRQRVLHLLDAIARSDLEAALSCCTDDVDFLTHAPIDVLPHMGPCHGKQELGEFWRTVQERYAEIRYEVPQIIAEGDAVAAYLRVFFRKRSNDASFRSTWPYSTLSATARWRRSARSSIPTTWCS